MKLLFSPPSELAIVGITSELGDLREGISRLASNQVGTFSITAEFGFDPAPYTEHLRRLRIEISDGPTLVHVDKEGSLSIHGSPESLSKFASFIDVRPGDHTHFEYFPGADWIHEHTTPLVVENHVLRNK